MSAQGSMDGPYDATNYGVDAYQHPVNQYGRCAKLNSTPPTCPPSAAERTTQLLAMPAGAVRSIGVYLGVPNAGTILIALLVPLIVAAEGLV